MGCLEWLVTQGMTKWLNSQEKQEVKARLWLVDSKVAIIDRVAGLVGWFVFALKQYLIKMDSRLLILKRKSCGD